MRAKIHVGTFPSPSDDSPTNGKRRAASMPPTPHFCDARLGANESLLRVSPSIREHVDLKNESWF